MIETIKRLLGKRSVERPEVPLSSATAADLWGEHSYGRVAGEPVTQGAAMRFGTVNTCARIIAESCAVLPLKVYQRHPNGDVEPYEDHPAYTLLHDAPNDENTAVEFLEVLAYQTLIGGNGYAEGVWDGGGNIRELRLLDSNETEARREKGTRALKYVTQSEGRTGVLDPSQVLHIKGLGWDGVTGYSPVGMQRQAIGLGIALENFDAFALENGAWLGAVLEHPMKLKPEVHQRMKESMAGKHGGVLNAFHPLILEDGMKLGTAHMPGEDAMFLGLRQFQKREIISWYRVPPHMVADMEKGASFASIEQMSKEFVTYTLGIWLKKIEAAATRLVRRPKDGAGVFVEYVRDAFLQATTKDRYDAHSIACGGPFKSVNEVRARENLATVEGGDEIARPLNMGTVGEEEKPEPPAPPPFPPAPPAGGDEEEEEEEEEEGRMLHTWATETMARLVRKEQDRVLRHAKLPPEEFRVWVARFYADHRTHAIASLEPLALCGVRYFKAGGPPDAREIVRRFVDMEHEATINKLVRAHSAAKDFPVFVSDLFGLRPGVGADVLCGKLEEE